jgi:hypothetical protein
MESCVSHNFPKEYNTTSEYFVKNYFYTVPDTKTGHYRFEASFSRGRKSTGRKTGHYRSGAAEEAGRAEARLYSL